MSGGEDGREENDRVVWCPVFGFVGWMGTVDDGQALWILRALAFRLVS